jgi:hypothetical protein
MTVHCENKLDAMDCAVTRLRGLGIPSESLIAHNDHIMDGWIVVSKDRPCQRPWFTVFRPEHYWEGVKAYAGLL